MKPLTYWQKLWIIVRYEYRWNTLKTYLRDHVWEPLVEGICMLIDGILLVIIALLGLTVVALLKWTSGVFVIAGKKKYTDEVYRKLGKALKEKKKP